jgi:glycosyltransferase involved in cell wall biosynthesis
MTQFEVSVVIPVYNNAQFIGFAIESVLSQVAAPTTEIIVVDDGSEDGSGDAAAAYAGVRVIRRTNGGIGAARNTGFEVATGRLIAFLDADDLFTERRQAVLSSGLEEADSVFGRVVQFRDDGWESEPDRATLASSMMIRRDAFARVGSFDENVRVGEFIDWWARAEEAGITSNAIEDTVLRRRIHTTNTGITQVGARVDYTRVLRAALQRRRKH